MEKHIEKLPSSQIAFYNRFLAMKQGSKEYKRDCQISSATILLDNNMSVDFNLVNGNSDSGPYLDVVLFDENGCEIESLPPFAEKMEGLYSFDKHGVSVEIIGA